MLALARIEWLCCVTALLLLGAQDPAKTETPKPDERLRALMEKTDGLKSFVVEYRLTVHRDEMLPKDDECTIRLVYSAPGRLKLGITGSTAVDSLIADNVMTMRMLDNDTGETFMCADCLPIPAPVVAKIMGGARELFPQVHIENPADAAQLYARFGLSRNEDGEPCIEGQLGILIGRTPLLGWLSYLEEKAHVASEDAGTIVFEGEGDSRFVLQKATGFLENVRVRWSGGERSLQLVKLEIDTAIEESLFHPPEHSPEAQDNSVAFQESMFLSEAQWMRLTILGGIERTFRDDESTWNEAARSKSRRALEIFHASILDYRLSAWIEKSLPHIDKFCLWFQSMLASAGTDEDKLAKLEQEVEKYDQAMRKDVESVRNSHAGAFAKNETPKSKVWKDLMDIDQSAFESAFSERVEDPLLGRFKERIALAREGKLTDPNEGKAPSPSGH